MTTGPSERAVSASHMFRAPSLRWLLIAALAAVGCGTLAANASTASGRSRPPRGGLEIASRVFGRRYCELLLVHRSTTGFAADVYNSYGLNNCPAAAWNAIDTTAVAKANRAIIAVRNGPRFWTMDKIEKYRQGHEVIKDLGGLRMIAEAVLSLKTLSAAPYTIHRVDRETTFIYNAGRTVYELRASDASMWVMQSWSQQVDPTLNQRDLANLGSKLKLPAGWTYRRHRLTRPLEVVTVRAAAEVLQDNLGNTYSRLPVGAAPQSSPASGH
jgi:hypothetical protein